ncbi:MAG: sugar phosphate isomerase/epimerase, partial [Defluviitaleaceae bacterium]|nr:sugar phosphate isomerase/epimerase [Defluviitaleaceae bacterium]
MKKILLGGQIFKPFKNPDEWAAHVNELGFNAVYFPLGSNAPDDEIDSYVKTAEKNNFVIAEVGAWSNPMSPDAETAKKALQYCKDQLRLAERVGAKCCVNITGSCGEQWDGPSEINFSKKTF